MTLKERIEASFTILLMAAVTVVLVAGMLGIDLL